MMLFGPELYFPLGCYDLLNNSYGSEGNRSLERSDAYNLVLVGRLNPGQTIASSAAGLKALAGQLQHNYPQELKDQTFVAHALPRLSTSNSPAEENSLSVLGVTLIGMAGIVLLIASLNLANMLLARGTARRKEIAIRLALGGGRGRIIRQLLTEGFVLAMVGGLAGFILGTWSTGFLVRAVGAMAPVGLFFRGAANPALFAATFGFCTLATLFFALGPALKLSRTDVLTDLKDQAGEDVHRAHRRRWMPRNPLVVAQLALSLGLLTSAGLFIRGAIAAGNVDTGFKADDTILLEADASLGGYDQNRALQLYQAASDRLAALPGVQSVSIASVVPFGMVSLDRAVLRAGLKPGKDAKPATAAEGLAFNARWNSVGADYFSTMGLPLLRGRAFTKAEAESPGAPAVAIIDEALAKKLWPDGDALGQRIQFAERDAPKAAGGGASNNGVSESIGANASDPKSIEVVGIVPRTRWELFSDDQGGAIFVPYAQGFQSNVFFHVRTAARAPGSDAAAIDTMRRELHTAAPGVPLLATKTFRQHLDGSIDIWIVRIGAVMFSIFGGLALVLAAVGLYGVKSYSVARRTREIGIRMALGAAPGAVQALILREGVAMVVTGVVFGLLIGLGLGQLLTSMLYRVSPVDPVTFVLAPVVLGLVALLACYLPARRATRVNPLTALRSE
jgi:predicted permease